MQQIGRGLFPLFLVLLVSVSGVQAGWPPWDGSALVRVDGEKYSSEDFRVWWENWREKDMVLPETPEPFVDWILLFREAERMQIYEDPGYRKKVLTFLKARTLMLLKAEEVDSRISISKQAQWNRYRQAYVPLFEVNLLFFTTREAAEYFLEQVGDQSVDEKRFKSLVSGRKGLLSIRTQTYRPGFIDPGWREILTALEKGGMSQPMAWKKGFVVLRLQGRKDGDADDFERVRKQIQQALWKEQETRLSIQLLQDLRTKYHVKVDKDRLQQLDITRGDNNFSSVPLITTDHGLISEKEFMNQIRRMQQFRYRNGFSEDNSEAFKQQVLNAIIDQTLTSWEALSRHYETRPPFKATYTYYCRHRMIKGLEQRVFVPAAQVVQKDVEAYYRQHLDEFTRPEIIRMIIAEGSEEEMNGLWTEVAMGGDFMSLARERFGHDLPVRDIPIDHLQEKVREIVGRLSKGELSPVFSVEGHITLVQLVERRPSRILPLERVREGIIEKLQERRLAAAKGAFLRKLRAQSSIEVDQDLWQRLRLEIQQLDETKTTN